MEVITVGALRRPRWSKRRVRLNEERWRSGGASTPSELSL
jgi:hypothetical protein